MIAGLFTLASCSDDDDVAVTDAVTLGSEVVVTNTFQSVPFGVYDEFIFEVADAATVVDGVDVQIFSYEIDITEASITFTIPEDATSDLFRVIEAGTYDRYYFDFNTSQNIQGVSTSTTGLSARVINGSELVPNADLVIQISEGFDFNAGITFTVNLENRASNCTGYTWYADTDGDGLGDPNSTLEECIQPDGYVINADDQDDTAAEAIGLGTEVSVTNTFQSTAFDVDVESIFIDAVTSTVISGQDLEIFEYDVDISENAITFSIPDDAQSDLFRIIEAGTYDRYYFAFTPSQNIQSVSTSVTGLTASLIDGSTLVPDAQLVVEISEGFDFKAGISFTIGLN